jgi:integrase/recombinase XerD
MEDKILLSTYLVKIYDNMHRSEIWELRMSDVNLETGEVFIQGQLRTNSRTLKLDPIQVMHLYDYIQQYRKGFLAYKIENTDRFFLTKGDGELLHNAISRMLKGLRLEHPQIIDLKHIRGSVITNWEKEEGIIEAMIKAGHRYVSSTQRYQTNKYEELQGLLKNLHPLKHMVLHENK